MAKRDRSVMDQAHQELKRQIVTLALRPGERIDDIALADTLGLSRTPVREALFRLSAQGLVNVGERGGFTVRPLDLADISQLFEAHVVVARATARLLAARVTVEGVEQLTKATALVDAAIESRSPADISANNATLHHTEARLARNEHLQGMATSIHDQGQRLAFLCFGGDGHADRDLSAHFDLTCRDHHEALDAVGRHDSDAAERVAARHVHLFRQRVVEFLEVNTVDEVQLDREIPAQPLAVRGLT